MSMIKYSSFDAYQYDCPRVSLVKVSSRGLMGGDYSSFVKRAGDSFAEKVNNLPKLAGEELIHVIALTDTERGGPNRNGDGFRRHVCAKDHDTFVKHARFYRDHKNTDQTKSYGIPKLSEHDDSTGRINLIIGLNATKEAADRNRGLVADRELDKLGLGRDLAVSMATKVPYDVCFKAGTLVETDRGMLPIESIVVGDMVRTHTGLWKRVTKTMVRAYNGPMVDMEVSGIPETISSTASHPYLSVREKDLRGCHGSIRGKKRRHTIRNGVSCDTCSQEVQLDRDWIEAQSLHLGDYLTCPQVEPKSLQIGLDQAYLMGLYAGDGSLIRGRKGKKKDGDKRTQGLTVTLDNVWPTIIEKAKSCASRVTGRDQAVNPSGDGKQSIQMQVYHKELGEMAEFLIGTYSDQKLFNEAIFDLDKEHRLAFIGGLLDSDGAVDHKHRYGNCRISTINRTMAEQTKRLINGLGFGSSVIKGEADSFDDSKVTYYQTTIGLDLCSILAEYSAKAFGIVSDTYQRSLTVSIDGYTHIPITHIRHYYDECDVYNLSVEDDESYIVSGVAVHNCSWCENKARTRAGYCTEDTCKAGGLRNHIGRILENGHQLHADNPIVKWYDISHVDRGADPTAFMLGHLKEASDEKMIGGAEMAEKMGLKAPWEVMLEGDPVLGAAVMRTAEKVARAARSLTRDWYTACQPSGPLMDGAGMLLHKMGAEAVLTALAKHGVLLKPIEFVAFTTPDVLRSHPHLMGSMHKTAAGMFDRFLASDSALQNAGVAPWLTYDGPIPYELDIWAAKMAMTHGLTPAHRRARLASSALLDLPVLEKSANEVTDGIAETLNLHYCLYSMAYANKHLSDPGVHNAVAARSLA